VLYCDDTKIRTFLCFFIVFLPKNERFIRYTQILWITLCIDCYIQLLTAVFITVLLDCTKTRQPYSFNIYQQVMVFYEAIIWFWGARMKVTPSHWFFLCTNTDEAKLLLCFSLASPGKYEKIRIYLLKQAVRQLLTKPVDNSVYWLLYPALNCGFYYSFVKLYKNTTTW